MSKATVLINQHLEEYKSKPIQPLELTKIKKLLRLPTSSTASFKDIYTRDPVFCWSLIAAGQKATEKRTSHPFAADHAMSLIGLGGVKKLFSQIKSEEQQVLSNEVAFYLSSSLLAGELANQISKISHISSQAYWSALFYHLPDTILWYLQPQTMWRIYYRQLTIPKRITLFEESKLGFSLYEWRKVVAKKFHLSEQNQRLFDKQLPSSPKELLEYSKHGFSQKTPSTKAWHREEAWLIVLVNQLARAILAPWHTRSFQHTFKLTQQLISSDAKKLNRAIMVGVHHVSQNLYQSILPNPGVGYLLKSGKPPFPNWLINPQPHKKNVNTKHLKQNFKNISSQKDSEQKHNHMTTHKINVKEEATALITKISNKINQFKSSTELIQTGLKALINQLGYDRVSFMMVDYRASTVQTKIALSRSKKEKIQPDFDFKLPTPMSRFIEKQTFMYFNRSQHKNIWSTLPLAIQKQRVPQFIFCSLKPGKKISVLIYLDSQNSELFTADILAEIKKLMVVINKGLRVQSLVKQKKTA